MLLLLVQMLFVGLTFIVAMACVLSDPGPGCHQPPDTPKNWAWPPSASTVRCAEWRCRAGRHAGIKKFVRTVRRYRTVQIKAGGEILTAVEPQSDDASEALTKISNTNEH
jgi:hypothetical protein